MLSVISHERICHGNIELSVRDGGVRSHRFQDQAPYRAIAFVEPSKPANTDQTEGLVGFDPILRCELVDLLAEAGLLTEELLPIGKKLRLRDLLATAHVPEIRERLRV